MSLDKKVATGRPALLVDLDGVLVDFVSEVIDLFWRDYHQSVRPDQITQRNMAAVLQPFTSASTETLEAWMAEVCMNPSRGAYSKAKPYWDVHQFLIEYGRQYCVFVTSRPQTTEKATAIWLREYGFPKRPVLYAPTSQKGDAVKDFLGPLAPPHPPFALDDDPSAIASYQVAGFNARMVARTWNAQVTSVIVGDRPAVPMVPTAWYYIEETLRPFMLSVQPALPISYPAHHRD